MSQNTIRAQLESAWGKYLGEMARMEMAKQINANAPRPQKPKNTKPQQFGDKYSQIAVSRGQ